MQPAGNCNNQCRYSAQCELDNSGATEMKLLFLTRDQFGKSIAIVCCATDVGREELGVTNNTLSGFEKNELLNTRSGRKIESSACAPRVPAAEVYGGGSEYFPFWQLPLWPFSWIRMFTQEED